MDRTLPRPRAAAAASPVALPAGASDAEPAAPASPVLTPQKSGTLHNLIGISAVSDRVAWAAGRGGTFSITTDGGEHWRSAVVPGAEALQFRDVEAFSDRVAFLLAIGNGA